MIFLIINNNNFLYSKNSYIFSKYYIYNYLINNAIVYYKRIIISILAF